MRIGWRHCLGFAAANDTLTAAAACAQVARGVASRKQTTMRAHWRNSVQVQQCAAAQQYARAAAAAAAAADSAHAAGGANKA